ncbi:hypothetical protein [Oscillatoria sp. HE19RPO]|uniref:hypothetical protein n=1 Tax=Oscillatoria sp. HE19RPO TaxID=2954806 RepID=UPI0020C5346A|nr:hypothetical protein [Oscillatoria sp. HE19RPO]
MRTSPASCHKSRTETRFLVLSKQDCTGILAEGLTDTKTREINLLEHFQPPGGQSTGKETSQFS